MSRPTDHVEALRWFLVGLSRGDSANRLAAGVADLHVRPRRRTRDALVLSTFVALLAVACGSSEGATDAGPGARTPEQITAELNVTADDLGESWEEVDREPFESSELLPQCHLDNEVDATIQTVEFENATAELGALQLVGVFDSSADASALMNLWQDDPYTCIDENVVVTELDFELGDADEAVRLMIGFSDVPQTIRQEVAVVRYGDTVVIALANSGSDVEPSSIEMLLQQLTGRG
jgi:hypothetical protein